ncbi:hypothetical protein DFJ73DRAFT_930713 [Zopfochytrium polystomum]|nr:hypothetical protein DFJ73DRAFT_930713 [Zopfochytrium polystomum]
MSKIVTWLLRENNRNQLVTLAANLGIHFERQQPQPQQYTAPPRSLGRRRGCRRLTPATEPATAPIVVGPTPHARCPTAPAYCTRARAKAHAPGPAPTPAPAPAPADGDDNEAGPMETSAASILFAMSRAAAGGTGEDDSSGGGAADVEDEDDVDEDEGEDDARPVEVAANILVGLRRASPQDLHLFPAVAAATSAALTSSTGITALRVAGKRKLGWGEEEDFDVDGREKRRRFEEPAAPCSVEALKQERLQKRRERRERDEVGDEEGQGGQAAKRRR